MDTNDCYGGLDNHYTPRSPQEDDRIIAFQERNIYIGEGEGIVYPRFGQLAAACESAQRSVPACRYLFSVDGIAFFLAELEDLTLAGYHYHNLFAFRTLRPLSLLLAGDTAWHLHSWYRTNRFCGACGQPLVHSDAERMLQCSCGNQIYPKISPTVMVLVTSGTQVLLTKYAGREYTRHALIAGFSEIGETSEETVAREVQEEVGLRVRNIRHFKSQPWGVTGILMQGFFAEAENPKEVVLDETELASAEWVEAREIAYEENPPFLMGQLLQTFRREALGESSYA